MQRKAFQVKNKRAPVDYELLETYEAGVSLLGSEVKAIRDGRATLNQSFVRIVKGEVVLVNASISPEFPPQQYNPTRSRKLLLKKSEISSLVGKVGGQSLTIVPIRLYNKGNLIKLEMALARSKKKYQKKARVQARDIERDVQRALKDYERS